MRGFSSPSEFDSLSALYEMFPLVPADTIRLIHLELGSDPTATASFLISEAEHSGNITGSTTGKNKADFFKRIPAVQLDVILAFLTFVDLATFSAVRKEIIV